jgi:hypothetical protein
MRAALVAFGLLGMLLVPARSVFAAPVSAGGSECSLATLRGRYILYTDGQATAFIGTPQAGQEVDIGMFTSDGNGNIAGSVTFGFNGRIFRTKFTGSYLINSDCTATATIQDDLGEVLQEEGVIFPDGREFRFIETNPGMLVARVARRLSE